MSFSVQHFSDALAALLRRAPASSGSASDGSAWTIAQALAAARLRR